MSLKKFLCGALAASMIFSASVFCSAASDESAADKLARIETDTYGAEQSGAILDRISRLEKSYSGQNADGNMNTRINMIYNALYENDSEPGVLAKINALEWNINHEVKSGGVDKRLAALENEILGNVSEGSFNERILALAKASYGEEILPIAQIPIPMNTLIKVVTTIPVGSKVLQEGDTIPIKVAEDVFVDGGLVFAKGLPGEGTVISVRRAKHIFSNGKIDADFHTLKAIDGQDVDIFTGIEAVEAMVASSMERGLSLLGQTFSGKNKELEEVLVRGKNIDLPAGVELYVQIKKPIVVYGVKSGSKGTDNLLPDETITPIPNETTTPMPVPIPDETTPPTPAETITSTPDGTEPLTPDEQIATPPSEPEDTLVQTDPEPSKPAPPEEPNIEPRPEEGKTPDDYEGEIIEIIDED